MESAASSQLESKLAVFRDTVTCLAVVDQPSFDVAAKYMVVIAEKKKEINATFDDSIKKAHAAHKAAVALKKQVESRLLDAEDYLRGQMNDYLRKQQDEADRIAAKLIKAAEEAHIDTAIRAEAEGLTEVAESILDMPVSVPTMPTPVSSTDGVGSRTTWKAKVTSLRELAGAVAAGLVSTEAIAANDTWLNKEARRLENKFSCPGVQAYKESSVVIGGRKEYRNG